MDFKFGPYIRLVHPNKKAHYLILENRERGRIQALSIFLLLARYVPNVAKEEL